MSSSRKIILKSSDGVAFDVDEAVALQSQTIKHMIELGCADNEIPLPKVTSKILSKGIEYCKKHVAAPNPEERSCVDEKLKAWNVTSKILSKVIEYCKKHVKAPMPEERSGVDEELKAWDANFVKVDRATLFDLVLAANYLNIQSLLDLTCQAVADMVKGKNPVEIAKFFNTDFTPEEEEKLRRENSQINTWRLLALIRPTLALIWKTLNFIYEIETPIVLTPEEVALQNEWALE